MISGSALRILGLIATLALFSAFTGCGQNDCERTTLWVNGASSACQVCQSRSCSMQRMAMSDVQMDCQSEFNCTARCPARSGTTCGCFDQCLITPACNKAFFDMLSCASQQCDSECSTGIAPRADSGTTSAPDAGHD